MDNVATLILLICIIVFFPHQIKAAETAQWDECGCRWEAWEEWGTCSQECNGRRSRSRQVWMYTNKPGCVFEFSTCATPGSGWDYSRCNTFCYNGGTSDEYSCDCVNGYNGLCCGFQITCGDPGLITGGVVHGMTYTYGANVSYSCNTNYTLVDGDSSRTCMLNSLWSGNKPRCAYFNSCASGPCQNSGTCKNIPDDYECTCAYGWSGKDCDFDILYPEVSNCSNNKYITTENLTMQVKWQEPQFADAHGFDIIVTSNYPSSSYTFPWDDFTVSYSAVKPSNGLQTDCTFDIKVRPNPCNQLTIPENGAVICSNWRTDYGKMCTLFCKDSYTVRRGVDPNNFYVCGASGSWTPASKLPDCSVQIMESVDMSGYKLAKTYLNCTENKEDMQAYYINKLKQSEFKYFCAKYESECKQENVEIRCL